MNVPRRVRNGAVISAGGLALLAACGMAASTGRVGAVERAVFHAVNGLPDWLYRPLWFFQQLGNLLVAFLVVLVLAVVLRRPRLAVAAVVAVVAKLYLEQVVKDVVQRARPGTSVGDAILRGQVSFGGLSFVSGHAVIAVAMATALSAVLSKRWRTMVWVLVALNGITRVYVGAHNPLDVVGGAGLGLAIGGPLYAWLTVDDDPGESDAGRADHPTAAAA
ncbi:MAG: phosphatase PAP2 family protein [Actinomycetota bacterium]|nr:phosphatase PAP2 family protein [Actinomycetota bacterium]